MGYPLSRSDFRCHVVACLAIWALVLSPLPGQTVTGTVLGAITDSTGAVVPGAEIRLSNPDTGAVRTVQADQSGDYQVPFVPPGTYEVTATQQGFRQTVRKGVAVAADTRIRVDLALTVGEVAESVEVRADIPLLQTADAAVGEVVSQQQITDLPLNKRNFMDLVQLTSGVAPGRMSEAGGVSTIDNFRGRFTFNANGQRSTTNNIMLDGVDNNANLFNAGGVVIAPVVDAIQEFKVTTANFSPEFGRAAGGVVSVQTKSGTNDVHGTVFYFLRNSAFDANTFFNNRAGARKPDFRQNQFGFTVGGPVVRNKTFFFGDYQGFRVREGNSYIASVPLPEARNGDFSRSLYRTIYDPATASGPPGNLTLQPFPGNRIPLDRMDPVARQLLEFYPQPNTNVNALANNFVNNPKLKRRDDQFDIRADHAFSDSTNFFARYSFGDADQLWPNSMLTPENPFGGGGRGNGSTIHAQGLAMNLIHTITPRLISESRFGFTRTLYIGRPLGFGDPLFDEIQIPNLRYSDRVQTIPSIGITNLSGIGPQANVPNDSVLNSFQGVQNFIWNLGSKHTLKVGGDLIRRQLNNDFTGTPSGSFSFNGSYTSPNARVVNTSGEPLADLLLGYYNSNSRDILLGGFGRRGWMASFYFQDDIKITRKLTVNAGARWDLWTPYVEVADRQATFDTARAEYILASPNGRLGRALRNTDWNNWAPRFGFAYDVRGDAKTVLRGGYSISYIEDLSSGRTLLNLNPPFAFSEQIVNAQGSIPQKTLQEGLSAPVIPPIDDRLAGQIRSVDANYRSSYSQSWSFGVQQQLSSTMAFDMAYVGTKGTKLMTRVDDNQPDPGPGNVNQRRPFFSHYPQLGSIDGLQSSGNSSYHSFQVKLTKRFSSGFQFLASYTNGRAIEGLEGVGETGVGAPISTRAQDRNNRRAEKALASFHMQQRFVASYSYELPFGSGKRWLNSGTASAILGGWSVQGITSLLDGNPYSVEMAASNLNTGTFQRPNRLCDGALDSGARSIDRYFDTSCFVAPPAYTFGNAGRNVLIGPGAVNFDFGALKSFRIRERTRMEFRSEFFNLFNTPQFNPPAAQIGSPSAGTISSVRGGSNRQIQFALKLLF